MAKLHLKSKAVSVQESDNFPEVTIHSESPYNIILDVMKVRGIKGISCEKRGVEIVIHENDLIVYEYITGCLKISGEPDDLYRFLRILSNEYSIWGEGGFS